MATTQEIHTPEGFTWYSTNDSLTVGLYSNLMCAETFGQTIAESFNDVDCGATTRLLA